MVSAAAGSGLPPRVVPVCDWLAGPGAKTRCHRALADRITEPSAPAYPPRPGGGNDFYHCHILGVTQATDT